jgi:hypothetical protein
MTRFQMPGPLQLCPKVTMENLFFIWAVFREPRVASYGIVYAGKIGFLIQI